MLKQLYPVLSALLVAGLCAPALAQPFRLIVTHVEPPLVPNSVMDLAVDLGYFTAEGVDVELIRVQQTPSAIAAMLSGEGDMANIAVDSLLQLVSRGADDLRAVASPNRSLPFLIAARGDIDTVASLAGRSFGVGRVGSLDHSLSMHVLAAQGLDTDSLQLLAIGQPPVRAQALLAERVDATTMSIGVWLSLPDRDGARVLVDQDAYYAAAPVINKLNVVPVAVLETRRPEVEAVLRALVRISRDFADNPDAWAAAMQPHASVSDPETLSRLARTFDAAWSVNGGLSRAELEFTRDWLYQTPDFDGLAPVDLERWVDFTVMDAVLADLGVDPRGDTPTR